MATTAGELIKNWSKLSKKDWRKRYKEKIILYNKWQKKEVREYQSKHNGIDIRYIIPKNTFYCYERGAYLNPTYLEDGTPLFKIKPCPFWYSIDVPEEEEESHPGMIAVGQTFIGGCKYLNKTDDDMDGFGLLWDQCKECGINTERH